ncbi:MAG TPA: gamma-glutamyltransferase [Gemmatimonadetes bacterium]|nr:gamma-glutamyltransferase [Gemmatimonadota bacterium]HIN49859.1 gamma-glutamyltransferase [Gemmatimonadota bacterium]
MRSPHRWRAVTLWTFALALAVLPIDVVAQTAEPVRASTGMVVSQHWLASDVGRDVLAAGGNAIDAAIATGFALAVVHPAGGNIGGGGFMVVRFPNGQTTAIDFREKAPLASFPEMWLDEKGEYSSDVHHRSAKSVGVPGTVAGFERAHKLYGDMDWQRLVSPAVAIAEDGFELSESLARSLAGFLERRARTPATVAQFSKDGTPYAEGETLRQPDLARTLRRIQGEGRDGFYRGETARLITEEMQRGDGIITRADLELYEARERSTIHGSYRGYEIISMPPPSSGGVAMVTMLNILEGFDLASLGHNSAPYIHLVSEAMRRAFRDRAHYLADADFVDVPVHELTSKAHGSKLRASIAADRASVSEPSDITMGYESPETTHYSVVDGNGMAVSVTYTLESGYGSGIVVSGGGFLLNNEMGDFNAGPGLTDDSGLIGTPANLARPQKRMLSSMTPSIVARDGRLVAVVGSPGGRTIINTVAQVILNVIDFGMNIQMAVNAPRIHHQWLPDRISIEGGGASAATVERLEAMGHTVRMGGGQGSANSIMIDPRTRDRLGAADPRRSDAGARGH